MYANKRLFIFDLDGTLVVKWTDTLLPGRVETLRHLEDTGAKIAIVTNQGGVGMRAWLESEGKDGSRYPTDLEVMERLRSVKTQLGVYCTVQVNFAYENQKRWRAPVPAGKEGHKHWDFEYRKPRPGMLLEAMAFHRVSANDTLMIGDSIEDSLAAFNALCDFIHTDVFFEEMKEGSNG